MDTRIIVIIIGLFTSSAGEWIWTIVKHRKYSSLKLAPRSTWYIIITWWINERIHITCDCLILPWKIPSLWCLTWIVKVGLFMIGLTTYEIFSHNNSNSANQLIVKKLPFVALRNPANLDNTFTYSPTGGCALLIKTTFGWYTVEGWCLEPT